MKVLVTGAGSLLLGGIARALAERGDQVVCFQRQSIEVHTPQMSVFRGDIRDRGAVSAAMAGCDAVIHGAARVGVVGSWEDFETVNIDGTANILRAIKEHSITKLLHVSTPSVCHQGRSIEGAGADRATTGRNGSFYAESKARAELLALAENSSTLGVVALRPHLVWGPGDTQLVGRIVQRATAGRLVMVGRGNALIDSTYIDNAISAHLAAVDAIEPGSICAGKAYVIANGEPRSVRELLRGICEAANVDFSPRRIPLWAALIIGSAVEKIWPLLRQGEPPLTRFVAEQLGTAHWFDPRPAHQELGWTPHVTLDEGFTRLAEWFSAQK